MKFSKFSGVVRWSRGTTVLSRGQSIDPDHPLALERPDLFEDGQPEASIRLARSARVETTMQRPGGVRLERPARKDTASKGSASAKKGTEDL